MRGSAFIALLVFVGGCSDQVNSMPQPQTFDVDRTGTPTCPSGLYESASANLASCTQPPEMCVSGSGGASTIQCDCASRGDAGHGTWSCRQATDASTGTGG